MKLVKKFLTENKCYKVYIKHTPVGIFLHSVGCPQPSADVFVKNWNTYKPGGHSVCVHGFISDKVAYQTLPWDCTSWHSGQGKINNANFMGYLGFELTEPSTIKYTGGASFKDNNPAETLKFVQKTYDNAVDIYAQICIELKFNPLGKTAAGYPVILSHSEGYKLGIASNHGDVEHLWKYTIKKTMDDFRNDVAKKMKEYNKDLGNGYLEEGVKVEEDKDVKKLYRVQVGAYKIKLNATNMLNKLKNAGYKDAFIKQYGDLYKVQLGAFSVKKNAENLYNELKSKGFDAFITNGEIIDDCIEVGDVVMMAFNAPVYGTNKKFQSWVYSKKLYVRAINGNKITVSTLKTGAVTGNVDIKYLTEIDNGI